MGQTKERAVELDDTLRFRISTDEKKRIEAEASRLGLTVSAFIRMMFRWWVEERKS